MKTGDLIKNYELIEQIGAGIAGEVWKAKTTDSILNKFYAIKFIAEKEFVNLELFRKEANIWNKASERNPRHIAYLHNAFECTIDSKKYYVIVIEYVSGGSLQSLIEKRLNDKVNFSIDEVKKIIGGILLGLIEIQLLGIVHRDIKPANIVIDQDGEPKLIDFGLSTQFDLEQSHVPRGTPFYMSPEAFLGGRSFQSDIWSVGVIFYLLLADRLPFPKKTNKEELTRDKLNIIISTEEYEPLPAYLPKEFDDILKNSLNKVVDKRYKTALEMYDEVMALPTFEPVILNDNSGTIYNVNGINEDTTKQFSFLNTEKAKDSTSNVFSNISRLFLGFAGIILLSFFAFFIWWFFTAGKKPDVSPVDNKPITVAPTPDAKNPRILKLATAWGTNVPILFEKVEEMAKEIEKDSGGRLKIEVLSANNAKDRGGNIIPPLKLFDAVSNGEDIQMAHTAAYYHDTVRGAAFFSAVPFGLNQNGLTAWINQDGMTLWKNLYNKRKVEPFECGHTGEQPGGWFKSEITSIKDFETVKIRMPGLGGKVLSRFRASIVEIPPTREAFLSAVDKEDVNAIEWIGYYHDFAFDLHTKFLYCYDAWQEPDTMLELIINQNVLNSLPLDLQNIIKIRAENYNGIISWEFKKENEKYKRILQDDKGRKFVKFPDEVKKELEKATKIVIDNYVKDDDDATKIRQSYENFIKRQKK